MNDKRKSGKIFIRLASVVFMVIGVFSTVYYLTFSLMIIRELIMTKNTEIMVAVVAIIRTATSIIMFLAGKKGWAVSDNPDEYKTIYFWGKMALGSVIVSCVLKGVYTVIEESDTMMYAYYYIMLIGLAIIYMYGGKMFSRIINRDDFTRIL